MMKFEIKQIGTIYTPYKTKEECPIQGANNTDGQGSVELLPEYEDGLRDIETFSHIILLYVFDRAGEMKLIRPTFLDDSPHGIFASRHPARPNGIGITIVRLLGRDKNVFRVSGLDMLDNTPLIDIKPNLPRFDHFADASNGWVEGRQWRPKPPDRE